MVSTDFPCRHRWLWPIALAVTTLFAFGLRSHYVSTAMVDHPIRGDATQYYAYAWNMSNHGTFAKDAPGAASITPDDYRDPGYPLFLAAWMRVLGTGTEWYIAVLLCQALLGALTVGLVTQLSTFWLPLPWAIGAGFLMAAWPHSITINGYLLSETLSGFLCSLGMLLCAQACRREDSRWAFIAGMIFGAAALTNAVLLPFGILLAGLMAWRKLAPRRICGALAVGALLLPAAWTIRNTQIPPTPAGTSSTDRLRETVVKGSWPTFYAAYVAANKGDPGARATLHAIDGEYELLRTSPVVGAKAMLRRLGSHPLQSTVWYMFEKPFLLWDWSIRIGQGDIYVYPTIDSPFQTNVVLRIWASLCRGLNLVLMVFAMGGIFFISRTRWLWKAVPSRADRAAAVAAASLVVFVTLVYSALQAEPRYSIAFRSFEVLLAFTSLCGAAALSRERQVANDQSDSETVHARDLLVEPQNDSNSI